jgi:hypothetical protein
MIATATAAHGRLHAKLAAQRRSTARLPLTGPDGQSIELPAPTFEVRLDDLLEYRRRQRSAAELRSPVRTPERTPDSSAGQPV